MNQSKQKLLAAAVLAAVGLMLTAPAQAVPLTTADLNASGDQLLTVNANSGLEFLDPAVTSGRTYNQIAASDFVTRQGFRIATTGEVRGLLSAGGITDFSNAFNSADVEASKRLLNDFIGQTITGPTVLPPAPSDRDNVTGGIYGFTEDPGAPAGRFNVAGLDYRDAGVDGAPQDQSRAFLNLISFPGDATPPNPGGQGVNGSIVGGFLVRAASAEPVPAPSSLGIMALGGLVLLTGAGLRRRIKSA